MTLNLTDLNLKEEQTWEHNWLDVTHGTQGTVTKPKDQKSKNTKDEKHEMKKTKWQEMQKPGNTNTGFLDPGHLELTVVVNCHYT